MSCQLSIIESILHQINVAESKSLSKDNATLIFRDPNFNIYTIEIKEKDQRKTRRIKAIEVVHGWLLTELK